MTLFAGDQLRKGGACALVEQANAAILKAARSWRLKSMKGKVAQFNGPEHELMYLELRFRSLATIDVDFE
jgi:hypothetical protein